MNWDAIGAIGEIIGASAVVLSLIYLASQVRISNRLGRAGAWRQPSSDLNSLNSAFGTDPVFRRGFAGAYFDGTNRSDLETDAVMALDFYFVSVTNLYEQLFREVREGILDDRAMKDFGARNLFRTPYYQMSWHVYRPNFGPSFVEYFEANFDLPSSQSRP